jgi:signal transduction histidine kinase
MVTVAASMVAALVAAVNRLRRSTGVERQQMKWFALSSGFVVAALPSSAALWTVTPLVHPLPLIALTAWPICIGVAILRYRLYDVDLVISRAFTGAVLTGVLALVYVGSTLAIGAAVGGGRGGGGAAWATAVSTLLAATAFQVLRRRVQRRVDSRFRPERHAALSRVTEFLDALRADRVEPEQVVEALRSALGDPTLELRFVLRPDEPPLDERGRPVSGRSDDAREFFAIERGGITLGQVVWLPRRDEQRALLPSVIAAAGLAIEMARLRVELRRRLDEVEASRTRIVTVADEERRRIERDLHDGAQQRLVSIGLMLRHAQHQLGPAVDAASRTLDDAIVQITQAIDELRDLAQGLHPALETGLRPVLHELASRAPLPVDVVATGERFPSNVESAAYFVVCEGLTNAVKHACANRVVLRVARDDGRCVVSVSDDGVGGASPRNGTGLTGLSDRVAAGGGRLRIDSRTGQGTTLTAEFPCVL